MEPTPARCALCDSPNPTASPACPGCGAPWTPAVEAAPRPRLRWPRLLAAGALLAACVAGAAVGGQALRSRSAGQSQSAAPASPESCQALCPGGVKVHTRYPWACGTAARRMQKDAQAARERGCPCQYLEVEGKE